MSNQEIKQKILLLNKKSYRLHSKASSKKQLLINKKKKVNKTQKMQHSIGISSNLDKDNFEKLYTRMQKVNGYINITTQMMIVL